MTPSLDKIIEWARQAGAILREGYGKRHAIDHKGRVDIVTEMDRQSEAYLIEQIQSAHPGDALVTEESGYITGAGQACWYIDPLDGTINYAHQIPIFTVSVAYAEADQVLLGVVYDPMRDECFSARAGQGAWMNGQPLHVSGTGELVSSLLVTGFPYDSPTIERNIDNFSHFTRQAQGVRRMGSAALDLCYVAAGRFDGYWEMSLRPYDLAAGALIAREAGACVTSMTGSEDLFQPPCSIVAANPRLHPLLLEQFPNRPA